MEALTFGPLRGFGRLECLLLLLSIASSVAFMATRPLQPFPGAAVLKGLGMAALALLAFRLLGNTTRDRLLLTAALVLSCGGDVFLQLDFRRYFVEGLAAFLLAHLTYIGLFAGNWRRPLQPSTGQTILVSLVLVYFALGCIWLWPDLGRLAVPTLTYAAAVTGMTISAILTGFSRPFVWVGAVLFLISDSLLAAGRFKTPLSLAAFLIWPTYYLAQYGITMGSLHEKAADAPPRPLSG